MSYVSKIEYDGAFYDIQDAVAQEKADTATSAAESAVATAEAAAADATSANETAEEAKAIAQGVAGSYSLDEIDTGAAWIDGRHIYKRTFNCRLSAMTASEVYNLATNITIENFDFLIDAELMQKYSTGLAVVLQYVAVRVQGSTLSALPTVNTGAATMRDCTIYYVKTS